MKILVTGITGYIGNNLVDKLLNSGHQVKGLIREGSEKKIAGFIKRIEVIYGDITSKESLFSVTESCDAIVHLPAIIREFPKKGITYESVIYYSTKYIVDSALQNKIKRFILISALGTERHIPTKYFLAKSKAENYLINNNLNWTIFRPSVVFGDERKGKINFITVLLDLTKKFPLIVPIIGNGKFRFQPIHINNLCEGIVKSISNEQSFKKIYSVAGKERFYYIDLLKILLEKKKQKKILLKIPLFLFKPLVTLFGKFSFFPISKDQLTMMLYENYSDESDTFFNDFNIKPILFKEGVEV